MSIGGEVLEPVQIGGGPMRNDALVQLTFPGRGAGSELKPGGTQLEMIWQGSTEPSAQGPPNFDQQRLHSLG